VSGLAVATMAVVTHGALGRGEISGPMMALLVLLPLALAEILTPLADAGALSAHTTAAATRLRRLERTPPAVRDTVATAHPASYDVDVDRVRGRWQHTGEPTAVASLTLRSGERVALVGLPARARAPWPPCCCASSIQSAARSRWAVSLPVIWRWTTFDG